MEKISEDEIITGNAKIDNGLKRIREKIKLRQNFGKADIGFVLFLMRKKLDCEKCRAILVYLFLHLQFERIGTLNYFEIELLGCLRRNRAELGIPNVQRVPIDDD